MLIPLLSSWRKEYEIDSDEGKDKEEGEEGRQSARAQNAHCEFIEESEEEDSDGERRTSVEKDSGKWSLTIQAEAGGSLFEASLLYRSSSRKTLTQKTKNIEEFD